MKKPTQKEWYIMNKCINQYLNYIKDWNNPNSPYQSLMCAFMEVPLTVDEAFKELK